MTTAQLRLRAAAHRTLSLAGTSEGASKGWETRKAGQTKDEARKEYAKAVKQALLEPPPEAGTLPAPVKERTKISLPKRIVSKRMQRIWRKEWREHKDPVMRIAASQQENRPMTTSDQLRNLAAVHRTIHATRLLLLYGTTEGCEKGWATRKNGDGGLGDAASTHADGASHRAKIAEVTVGRADARAAHLKARAAHRAAALAQIKLGNKDKAKEHRAKAEEHWTKGQAMAAQERG